MARNREETGKEGKPLPIFSLLLADSTTYFTTRSIPAGKPVVLFYFGTHCPYSHAQMEEIVSEMDKMKDIRFYLITTAPFNEMKAFCKQYALNEYPNVTVGRDYTEFFSNYYEARGVPFTAIYRKNKILHEAFIGKISAGEIIESTE
ncbi:hypothetical protein GCM10022209_47800 [Chitinophaga oryziterrae]